MAMTFNKLPPCLTEFDVVPASSEAHFCIEPSATYDCLQVRCRCGNDSLYLEAAPHKELKGVCIKAEYISFVPPAYFSCPACKRYQLLFDPFLHGIKAELNEMDDDDNPPRVIRCVPHSGNIFVSYSYPTAEVLAQAKTKGVLNLENCFDRFKVSFSDKGRDTQRDIFLYTAN